MEKEFINVKELSNIIGLGVTTINKYVMSGKIPSYKVGGRRLFNKDEVIEWMKGHKEENK